MESNCNITNTLYGPFCYYN